MQWLNVSRSHLNLRAMIYKQKTEKPGEVTQFFISPSFRALIRNQRPGCTGASAGVYAAAAFSAAYHKDMLMSTKGHVEGNVV